MSSGALDCDSFSSSCLVQTTDSTDEVFEVKADWRAALPLAELCIAEHILTNVTTKLRYLLPPDIVGEILERQRQRTEISQDGIDSSILRDVLLQDFRGKEHKATEKAGAEQDSIVQKTLEKLFAETSAWEQDEETAVLGMNTLKLFEETLRYLPHAHERSVECLEGALHEWQDKKSTERTAKTYSNTKKSEIEMDLQELTAWTNAERNKVEALIEDMRHQVKVAEGESSEIAARVLVEKEYIKHCAELTTAYEYWRMEMKENEVERKEAHQKALLIAIPNATTSATAVYEKLLNDLDRREMYLREQDYKSRTHIQGQLNVVQEEAAQVESELNNSRMRTMVMQEEVLKWHVHVTEEKAHQMHLTVLWNAAIKIQRWWRWINWKRGKYDRTKKKKGGKSKSKSAKK